MNLGSYASKVRASLNQLEHLVGTINDLVENRIEKNLKVISRILLVDLPTDRSVTLDEFVSMQELKVWIAASRGVVVFSLPCEWSLFC